MAFLEEIQLTSTSIEREIADSKSYREKHKAIIGGTHLLRKPQIMPNGELLINVVGHGNFLILPKDQKSEIVKKYELAVLDEPSLKFYIEPNCLLLKNINNCIFAYERDVILKQVTPDNPKK